MSKILLPLLFVFSFSIFSNAPDLAKSLNKTFSVYVNKENDKNTKISFEKNKTKDFKNTFIIDFSVKNLEISEDIKTIIKEAAEVIITQSGYSITDDYSKDKISKITSVCIDKNQNNIASNILTIEIINQNNKLKITAVVINVETTAKISTDFVWYHENITDFEKLDKDMRELFTRVFENITLKNVIMQNITENDLIYGDNEAVTIVKRDGEKTREGKYKVTIKSNPTNAEIYDDISGKFWGKTPFEAEMPEGVYTVSVEGLQDFDTARRTFKVTGNVEFTLNMRSLKHKTGVIIDQPSAKIYIDGEYIGQTSYKANDIYYISLKEGERKIKIEKDKYKTIEEKLNITSSKDYKFTMKENFSVLTLRSNPVGATVYLNEIEQDITPLKLKLENGKEYTIKFVFPDFENHIETIKINDDTTKDVILEKIKNKE